MASTVAGLFGLTPEELQVQLRKEADVSAALRDQQISNYGQGLGPFASVVQSSARMGEGLGSLAQGLFGQAPAEDPRMTRALNLQQVTQQYGNQDLTDPEVMKTLISDLNSKGLTREAFSLLGDYQKTALERAKASKGAATKPSDVGSFITQARQNLGPLKNQLTSIETGRGYIQAARAGNPKAEAQLDRYLAKASGDSQLSMAEVTTVATAGGFGQRVVDSINKFFTGNAGELTLEQKEEVLNVLEIAAAKRYNDERTSLGTAYTGLLPDYIVESNLPGINVSQQAQDYMKKANKQQAAAAASTPLSPNASKYLGTKPTGTTPVAPNQPITTPIAPRTSVVPSEQDYYNIAP